MKAMLLTAGLGTRLRPLTLETAKPSIPVLGIPLIVRTMQTLESSGISACRLNLHFLPHTVKQAIESFQFGSLEVSYSYESKILGTGGGLKSNESFFDDENFLMVNGDIFFDFPLEPIVDFHIRNDALATLALYPQMKPYQYTPISIDSEYRIRDFPRSGRTYNDIGNAFVFTGVTVLSRDIFSFIKPHGFADIVADGYEAAMALDKKILGFPVSGHWNDLGTASRYLSTQRMLFDIYGWNPAIFVDDTTVLNDEPHIGPYVTIGKRCIIQGSSRIEDSILWDDCHVGAGSTIRHCILGHGVSIQGNFQDRILTLTHGESVID